MATSTVVGFKIQYPRWLLPYLIIEALEPVIKSNFKSSKLLALLFRRPPTGAFHSAESNFTQ